VRRLCEGLRAALIVLALENTLSILEYSLAGCVAFALCIYLFFALLFPEKF
jgi:K+-transporting ATPase KdpF subunit